MPNDASLDRIAEQLADQNARWNDVRDRIAELAPAAVHLPVDLLAALADVAACVPHPTPREGTVAGASYRTGVPA